MGVLLLVRHGQASFGADDYDVLSETGWQQARLLGRWLGERGLQPDLVVRGSMRRHRETAEAMIEGAGWTSEPRVDADWDEFDHLGVVSAHGESVDGLDRREFQLLFERATARWTSGESADYPETYAAFLDRVSRATAAAATEAGSGRTVVAVTSGGAIGAVCARLSDPDADQPALARMWSRFNAVTVNSAVTRVLVGSTGMRLLTFNEHPHVEGDTLTYR
ncbi:histidine phosphatase family protein [Nocardioides sp. CN2-186]|uniref:histidine phosphatase family protein n=1 Tax=Nocardioides tweenelious TaxID=3156607 RepID=UPI0032B5FDDF